MNVLSVVLGFGWAPEIRGIVFVLIMVLMLMGSTYLILATNIGARLGLLVACAALFGWLMCMASIWAVYGIGLKGKDAKWVGQDIVLDGDLANASHPVAQVPNIGDATLTNSVDGWRLLAPDDRGRGQAIAAADEILVSDAGLPAGTFEAVNVYDKGGARYPLYFEFGPNGEFHFDWLSFWHKPHYTLVEVQALVPQNTEPGKAPPPPIIDTTQPSKYVLMIRDLGTRRRPAFMIAIGSAIIFGVLCWMLHRRDAFVDRNRSEAALPAKTPVGAGV
jgi:hypothetical protein